MVEEHRRRRRQNLEEGELSSGHMESDSFMGSPGKILHWPCTSGPLGAFPSFSLLSYQGSCPLGCFPGSPGSWLPAGFDQALAEIGEWEEGSNQGISPHPHLSPHLFLAFIVSLACLLLPAIQACPGFSSQGQSPPLPPH